MARSVLLSSSSGRRAALTRRRFLCHSAIAAAGICLHGPFALAAQATLPFIEIEDGIFVRYGVQEMMDSGNAGAIANIGFIAGSRSVAVIDTGTTRQQGAALRRAVEEKTGLPVSHLIATHVHLDHCFGHAAFGDLELVSLGHHKLPQALQARGPFYEEEIAALSPEFADTRFVLPNATVESETTIDLGDRTLRLTAWPAAHTDNDLTVFDERTSLLWASDLLFVGRLPTIDGSLTGWLETMEQLASIEASLIMPGHGLLATGREALERQSAYFTELRDAVREAIDSGADIAAAVDEIDVGRDDGWLLYEDNHGRNVTAAYAELEWE